MAEVDITLFEFEIHVGFVKICFKLSLETRCDDTHLAEETLETRCEDTHLAEETLETSCDDTHLAEETLETRRDVTHLAEETLETRLLPRVERVRLDVRHLAFVRVLILLHTVKYMTYFFQI